MRRAIAAGGRRLRAFLPAAVLGATGWDSSCTGSEGPLVVFLGDSLTEGWGLSRDEAYPALVARDLAAGGRPIRAVNAGRSGDTVAQGLARLPGALRRRPDVLVVALGVNDALRGMSAEDAERDLRRVVADARAADARVLLVGVLAPPPLATAHTRRFEVIYARLAADERLAFLPDLMAGAAGDPGRMFPDGLHPNGAGQRQLADNVRPALDLVLAEVGAVGGRAPASPGTPR
jgi:acyl-CoA thioesterase-1